MNNKEPIVVVGAGPAGLFAAIAAAQAGAQVVVVEQLDKPGVKLLATGGGRCNVTNLREAGEFMARLGRQGRFLQDALAAMDSRGVVTLLAELDVPTCTDGPRVYPTSHSAQTVQQALVRRAQELGVHVCLQTVVTDVAPPGASPSEGAPPSFMVSLSRDGRVESTRARAVIVATGGRSYAKLGGTGGGYELARRLGHTVTPLTPALVGLVTREDWVRTLAGVSLSARVNVMAKGAARVGVRGDVLFTHHGLSGPTVLDISGDVAERLAERKEVPLALDVTPVPGEPPSSPAANHAFWMREFSRWQSSDGTKAVTTVLAHHLPARLTSVLCEQAGVDGRTVCAHLPGDARRRLASTLSALPLTTVATDGWEKAMVTRGGVSLKQINPCTLGSRLVAGLYFAGEVLDLDGPSGGFNLQIAFSTGHLAGLSAATR